MAFSYATQELDVFKKRAYDSVCRFLFVRGIRILTMTLRSIAQSMFAVPLSALRKHLSA